MIKKFHIFHIITPSPWPLIASTQIINMVSLIASRFSVKTSKVIHLINIITTSIISSIWWNNTIKESNKEGSHPQPVTTGLKLGILLFITSEVLFFLSFFWAYFHISLSPNIELGQIWPPILIKSFNPTNVPLLNTIILIRSGVSVTWSHHSLLKSNLNNAKKSLMVTCLLGVYFSILQAIEYSQAEFSINDSSYGSIFFMATGFHGIHVIIGTTFLSVNLLYINKIQIRMNHHIGFEMAAWYWHFVDVVWLFLYISVYWWGK